MEEREERDWRERCRRMERRSSSGIEERWQGLEGSSGSMVRKVRVERVAVRTEIGSV